jgi:hypothetical protein
MGFSGNPEARREGRWDFLGRSPENSPRVQSFIVDCGRPLENPYLDCLFPWLFFISSFLHKLTDFHPASRPRPLSCPRAAVTGVHERDLTKAAIHPLSLFLALDPMPCPPIGRNPKAITHTRRPATLRQAKPE